VIPTDGLACSVEEIQFRNSCSACATLGDRRLRVSSDEEFR
jgi:hypothetical protein